MSKKIILFFLSLVLLYNVLAYIDPGTGGMIIGGSILPTILAILAAIGGFFVRFLLRPTKNLVLLIWKRIRKH